MRKFYDPLTLAAIGLQVAGGIAQGQQEKASADAEASFLRSQAALEERAAQREQRDLEKEKRRTLARTRAVLAAEGGGFGGTGQALLESQAGEFAVKRRRIAADSAVSARSLRTRSRNTEILGEAARDAAIFGGVTRAAGTAARSSLLRKSPSTGGDS